MVQNIRHVTVGGGKNLLCHWPRQGGLWVWGSELLAAYIESPCSYSNVKETGHGQDGIWKKGYIRLRRSTNGGRSWENAGTVFDNSLPIEQQRKILNLGLYMDLEQDERSEPTYVHYFERSGAARFPPRESFDPSAPDSIILMGRAWCGKPALEESGKTVHGNVAFAFRSSDRGRSWEKTPTVILPNHTETLVELANNWFIDDDRLYAWFVGFNGVEGEKTKDRSTMVYSPQLYASDSNGETFDFYKEIYADPTGRTAASYPHIIRLESGRWLCFLSHWFPQGSSRNRWTSLLFSDDKGLNWSQPRTIQSWCVSPYPLRLRDGRILVISMRRNPDPTGLTLMVSEDDGNSWRGPEFLRNDTIAAGPTGGVDGGYPVAVEVEENRVFVAYYWQIDEPDIPWYGGRKFIGGTFFDI